MSSVAGLTVDPFSGAYSASKHAIEVFSEALYKETRTMGIDILTINPGPFLTGFNDRMFEAYTSWRDTKNHFDYSQLNFPHEQYDPELLINEASRIITAKNPLYRNVLPKEIIDEQKDQLSNVWKRHVKDSEGEEDPLVKKAKQLLKETPVK